MRNLHSMRDKSFGCKKETLTEALNMAFRTPKWQRLVDYAEKVYPCADGIDDIKDFVRFILPQRSLVWFTEKYSFYKKGDMDVMGPTEFDAGFYDREDQNKDGVDGIYFIPIELLTYLNKENETTRID